MTNAQHTAGPWRVDDHPRREYPRVTDARGRFVADCTEQDARLIAAAPDLLAALVELLPCVGWSNETDEGLQYEADAGNETAPRIMRARAAIAKAAGEQP